MSSPIPVNNSSIPVNEFVNTVDGKFFKDLGRFEIEIEDSKNMGCLELCLDMGPRIKKNRFCYKSVPRAS